MTYPCSSPEGFIYSDGKSEINENRDFVYIKEDTDGEIDLSIPEAREFIKGIIAICGMTSCCISLAKDRL